ncbi:BTB/POZ domain-containing protein [Ditylenchus destructor]|uniref:BTB/POZ domain-containing protein n=1 Tax=Ditylenchus destructor TaxID=166010 RepID=A0AAD4MY34_9BILA|nr:BTB/POZ domain-containing protein [Ditylenchus destructor]
MGISKVPNVSKQFTEMIPVSAKLEWRIEHFDKALRFYKQGQWISSETFITPHLKAVWRLSVYPNGTEAYSGYVYFYLWFCGFKSPNGTLSNGCHSANESVMADYKIYLVSSTHKERVVLQKFSEFKISTPEWQWQYPATVERFIHPDGSLIVACEIECLAPKGTLSIEPTPNPEVLDANLRITDRFKEILVQKVIFAHKCILSQWSEVFRNMFSLPTEEARSGVVNITDFSTDAISAMLEYMYTGVVKNEVMDKIALEILVLANKYAVIPLKEMCEVFLASKLTATNVLEFVTLADRYSAAKLKKACVNRLAIDGRAALQSKEWEDLKNKNKDLADELLELLIKDRATKS